MLITTSIINYCDNNEIFMKWKRYRNNFIIFIVPSITNLLFVNELRFDWCYKIESNAFLNIMMYIWLTIVLFIYLSITFNENY